MSVTNKIKEYLRIEGIAKSYLAEKLSISQPAVSKILNKSDLKVSTLQRIESALNLPSGYFMSSIPPDKPDRMRQLEEKIETLSAKVDKVSSL